MIKVEDGFKNEESARQNVPFALTAAAHFSLEWDSCSKKDGVQRMDYRLPKK